MAKLARAPSNDAEIGGLKVVIQGSWFAVCPSETEETEGEYHGRDR
jgi:phosphoglucomutase